MCTQMECWKTLLTFVWKIKSVALNISQNVLMWVYFHFGRTTEREVRINTKRFQGNCRIHFSVVVAQGALIFRACSIVICNQLWLLSCDDGFQRECYSMSKIVMRKKLHETLLFVSKFDNSWARTEQNLKLLDSYYYLNHAFWCIFGNQK